jgi:cyclophilin family peptidyl-prolyl cis-trans isomerase
VKALLIALAALIVAPALAQPAKPPAKPLTMADILKASTAADWRSPNPDDLVYLELATGRVIIELAPDFAPNHVANIKALIRESYFDGLSINRVQESYVVQWGDPEETNKRPMKSGKAALAAEFDRPITQGFPFTKLPDADGYAQWAGFTKGFPVARGGGRTWLTHCYGMVGAGRDTGADTGSGAELYVVIGHAPRNLDRNVTLVGRVLQGMSLLTTLPRGTGPLGFYEKPVQRVAIKSIRLAADVPEAQRTQLEVFRTDTAAFKQLIEARRNRRDEWYVRAQNFIDLCNVPIPVRAP